MRRWVREALLTYGFFQVVMTPFQFVVLRMGLEQYAVWTMLNIPASFILGPALVALVQWTEHGTKDGEYDSK